MKVRMKALWAVLFCLSTLNGWAQDEVIERDISYTEKTDSYAKERLTLDVYHPLKAKDAPVVVWFHGGGLTSGNKELPEELKGQGLVVVGVNYRLLPKVTIDQTLDDAAEAVAWVFRHAAAYGGNPHKIYVSGHSAGGYLTMMLCLDKTWLGRYAVDADSVAAYIPFSGQAISHFAYRQMNGIGNLQPTVDRFAPLYWVRADCPPLVLITGDAETELFGRYEENAYLWRMMRLAGHRQTYLYKIDGHDHVSMMHPAFHILLSHLQR